MKTNQILIASLVTGTALMVLGLPVSASVETFTATYGSSSSPLLIGGPAFPASLTLQEFDTSLGQLTDIKIFLTTDELLQAEVVNFGTAAGFVNAQGNATLTVSSAGGTGPTVSLATTPFSGSLAPGASVDGPTASLAETVFSSVAPADFSGFEHNGSGSPLDVSLLGTASFSGTGSAGLLFGGEGNAYGSVEIEYDYATVPETGTLWADLGLLMCGFQGFRRMCRLRC
jgi:hypothetical protein